MRISIPSALRDASAAPLVGMGPFVIEHDGDRELGSMLYEWPDGTFTVQDMSRVLEMDSEYSAKVEGNTLVFTNEKIRSSIKVRPLEQADRAWLFPDAMSDNDVSQEALEEAAYQLLDLPVAEDSMTAAGIADQPSAHTFISLDDTNSVLELCRSDDKGVYVRSNGQWFMLDPTSEEEDTPSVWNREWVDVGDGAVAAFDAADQGEQQLNRGDFEEFIIAQ